MRTNNPACMYSQKHTPMIQTPMPHKAHTRVVKACMRLVIGKIVDVHLFGGQLFSKECFEPIDLPDVIIFCGCIFFLPQSFHDLQTQESLATLHNCFHTGFLDSKGMSTKSESLVLCTFCFPAFILVLAHITHCTHSPTLTSVHKMPHQHKLPTQSATKAHLDKSGKWRCFEEG